MDSDKYAKYSLQELYSLYTKVSKENNPAEAQIIFEQILLKEKETKIFSKNDELASLSERLGAAIVDGIIMGIPIFTIVNVFWSYGGLINTARNNNPVYTLLMLISSQLCYLAINGWLLYQYGQTIGKKILGIKIVSLKNQLPELYHSYGLRYFVPGLFPLIPFIGGLLGLADILLIFSKDRRCIHDHLAGTKVIIAS